MSSSTATVSVLFSDLVGSTALQSRLGDDANDEVRRRFFDTLRRVVAAHRGVEVKNTGDGLMVVFPTSTVDAVACAVHMQRAVSQLNLGDPLLRLAVRLGVSAGEATAEDGDWFGTPVVEAARLCAHARPGQVVVTDVVRALVGSRGGHEFVALGPVALKGFPEPTVLWEVPWDPSPPALEVPMPGALVAGESAFVGRDDALAVLRRRWAEAVDGRCACVVVRGDPGVGKTRLAAVFAEEVRGGAVVLFGHADDERMEPYQPLSEAIRWYAAAVPADELRHDLGADGGELVRMVPSLAQRLPDLAPAGGANADEERRRLFSAVATLLARASVPKPFLLVLDDLHVAAPAALEVVEHVVSAGGPMRVLVVVVHRPGGAEPVATRLASLAGLAGVSTVELGGLSAAACEELAVQVLGPGAGDVGTRLDRETGGNAARVVDLLGRLAGGADWERAVLESCPYKGLSSFAAGDAEVFFGRDDVVGTLLARLSASRLLVVTGPSGSGKSSVVAAGVLPALATGALPGSAGWVTAVTTPGPRPMTELAATLAPLAGAAPGTMLATLDEVGTVPDPPDGGRMLLVVDQLEELFTQCRDEAERRAYAELIARTVAVPGGRVSMVLVVRGDFYAECAAYPALGDVVAASTVLLGPMGDADLRAAITRPAGVAGLHLERGLVDTMVRDVTGQPGGLPLLSHALLETWQRRSGTTLTVAGYRQAGGVHGAIARTADTVYATLDADDQVLVRRVFVRLTELGEGTEDTRRRVTVSELVPAGGDPGAVERLVGRLAAARLVTVDHGTVEVAHEALIREWPRLRDWLDDDRERLRTLRHLSDAAAEWDREGRDSAGLYRGARLAATLDIVGDQSELNRLEHDFLAAASAANQAEAERERRRRRRLHRLVATMAVALAVATAAGGLALVQRNRAEHAKADAVAQRTAAEQARADAVAQRDQADQAKADAVAQRTVAEQARADADLKRLVADSQAQRPRDLGLSMLLAVEANTRRPTDVDTLGALQGALTYSPGLVGMLSRQGSFTDVSISPDGRRAAIGGGDGKVTVWDVATRRLLTTLDAAPAGIVRPTWSPTGDRLVVGTIEPDSGGSSTRHEVLRLFDTATYAPAGTGMVIAGTSVLPAALSGDGRLVAVATDAGAVAVWDTATQQAVAGPMVVPGASFTGASLDPRGRFLAATTPAVGVDNLYVFDVSALRLRRSLRVSADNVGNWNSAYSPDGTLLAVGTGRGTIHLLDAVTLLERRSLVHHTDIIESMSFSRDGRYLVTASDDGTAVVWDPASGAIAGGPYTNASAGTYAAISPDGTLVLHAGFNGRTAVWSLTGHQPLADPYGPPDAYFGYASPDGRLVATVTSSGLTMLDALTGAVRGTRPGVGSTGLAFSPDSSRVAFVVPDGVQILNVTDLTPTGPPIPLTHDGTVTGLSWSPDGKHLGVTWLDGYVGFLDLGRHQVVGTPQKASTLALYLDFSADGRRAGPIGASDAGLRLFDPSTGLAVGPSGPPGIAPFFSPTGTLFAQADQGIEVLDPTTLAVVRGGVQLLDAGAYWASFSPDGHRAVFAAAGTFRLATIDGDRITPVGEPFVTKADLRYLASGFLADGSLVFPGPGTAGLLRFNLDQSTWARVACDVVGRNMTKAEWDRYLPGEPYRTTCAQYPAGT